MTDPTPTESENAIKQESDAAIEEAARYLFEEKGFDSVVILATKESEDESTGFIEKFRGNFFANYAMVRIAADRLKEENSPSIHEISMQDDEGDEPE